VSVDIVQNLVKFNAMTDSFKFGVIGIYNTKREENAFYKIVATCGN